MLNDGRFAPSVPSRTGVSRPSVRPTSPAPGVAADPAEPSEGFQPLPLDLVAELDELPFDVYVRREGRMVLYAVQGADPFGVLLRARDGLELHVPLSNLAALRRLLLASLVQAVQGRGRPLPDRGRRTRTFATALIAPLFDGYGRLERDTLATAHAAIDIVTRGLSVEPGLRRALLERQGRDDPSRERILADRALDALVYTVALTVCDESGRIQGTRLLDVGRATVLRDVGLARLPVVHMDRNRPLDAVELAALRRHPTLGVDLLSRAAGEEPSYASLIAEHHERADGSGYPNGRRAGEFAVESQVVGLADAFVAVVSPRPGAAPYPLAEAIRILRFAMRGRFDDDLVLTLIGLLGEGQLLPVGEGSAATAH